MRPAIIIAVAFLVSGAPSVQRKTKVNPPIIKAFTSSSYTINFCPFRLSLCRGTSRLVTLTTAAEDKGALTYSYAVSSGRIEGTGTRVIWNLDEAAVGDYTATVSVKNAKNGLATAALTVRIVECGTCDPPPIACPQIVVECPEEIESGKVISFVAIVKGRAEPYTNVSYSWTTDAGRIIDGKYDKKMTLDLLRFPFEKVTATVSVGGYDPACIFSASCTTRISK